MPSGALPASLAVPLLDACTASLVNALAQRCHSGHDVYLSACSASAAVPEALRNSQDAAVQWC